MAPGEASFVPGSSSRQSERNESIREALAALLLFQEAVRQETLTLETLEEMAAYLKAARGNPELRFEAGRRASLPPGEGGKQAATA